MVTVDQIDVRKLYYAAKAYYGLQGSDDNAMLDRLCSRDGGAPCQAGRKMAGFSYNNVEVDPMWYAALGITPPPPACVPNWICESPLNGYEYDGCGNRRTNPACIPRGSISFSSVPGDAEIFLDGEDQGIRTPATITDVPAGAHTFTLKLANFNDYPGTVDVIEAQVSQVSATLDVMEGCIIFNTAPEGAKIYIDEVLVPNIVTPGIVCSVSLGTHTYKLVLAGYTQITGSVTLAAGKGAIVSETSTHDTGSISFRSIPDGARIIIDGVNQNINTPAIITEITGTHDYILRKAGFNDQSGIVTVSAGQTATVEATLVPAEGCINFNMTPAGAMIFIDNVNTGQVTPSLVCGLSLGTHTYRLVLSGYQDITGTVTLVAGQGVSVTGTLPKKSIGTGTVLGMMLLGIGALGAVVYATRGSEPASGIFPDFPTTLRYEKR